MLGGMIPSMISRIIPPPTEVITPSTHTPKMSILLRIPAIAPEHAKAMVPMISIKNIIEDCILILFSKSQFWFPIHCSGFQPLFPVTKHIGEGLFHSFSGKLCQSQFCKINEFRYNFIVADFRTQHIDQFFFLFCLIHIDKINQNHSTQIPYFHLISCFFCCLYIDL